MPQRIVDLMIKWEDEGLAPKDELELFSYLITTGDAWTLQGFYGRTADFYIENGYISSLGEILVDDTDIYN